VHGEEPREDAILGFKKGKKDVTRQLSTRSDLHLYYSDGVGCALMLVSDPIVRANPDPDSAAANATFRTKCAMCHGQDGAGSAVGKSMNVPDLRSPVVQKLSDAELAQVISNGKGGMPPFKGSPSEDQIQDLVTHIRSLQKK
jgi:mono/diheme cytochrome c family protein